jgi:hypothetical protein
MRTIALGSGTTVIVPDTTVDPFERTNGDKVTGINGPRPLGDVTATPPGIDDSEILNPVGDAAIELTEVVSNLKAGPGVNTRPLTLLELKLPAVAATAEVNVALLKLPLRIIPNESLIWNAPELTELKIASPGTTEPVAPGSNTKLLVTRNPLSMWNAESG